MPLILHATQVQPDTIAKFKFLSSPLWLIIQYNYVGMKSFSFKSCWGKYTSTAQVNNNCLFRKNRKEWFTKK